MKSPSWSVLISAAVGVVVAIIAIGAIRIGFFEDVKIETTTLGPYTVIAKDHLGAYHKMNSTIQDVENFVTSQDESCRQSFGEYFDDPNLVDEDRLTSRGGCLVNKVPENLPEGLKAGTIPQHLYVSAVSTKAPSLGPVKVYPKIFKYIKRHHLSLAGAIIEIYEFESDSTGKTRYLFPVEKIAGATEEPDPLNPETD